MSKPLLIGLTGPAGAGKSTAAQHLEEGWAFVELALAEPIRDMLAALFHAADIPDAWMTSRALKEQPTPLGFSYRHMAQTLGTEWGRSTLGPGFWLRLATLRLERPHLQGDSVVVSDIRFANEAAWLKARGGVLVRIERAVPAIAEHESEQHWPELGAEHVIDNNGSRAALCDQLDALIHTLRN